MSQEHVVSTNASGPWSEVDQRLLSDGLILVAKRDCPTCELIEPLIRELSLAGRFQLIVQDDSDFGQTGAAAGDRGQRVRDEDLLLSHRLGIETVPTLVRRSGGSSEATAIGWHRDQWRSVTRVAELGDGLPSSRPGCGALNLESPHAERLALFSRGGPIARTVAVGDVEDPIEACFARGWSDGLPVVPPTAERVQRMLAGTSRDPAEVLAQVAPNYGNCTVEKVAINAVMAGCLPEYLPVVLAAVEAACSEGFNWHGLAATTYFAGPVVVVSGPITRRIGMNADGNALGQGNRANATIGRALQLTLRNVGGARPGEIDRATLGNPGKLSFCFAEQETAFGSLAEERGITTGESAVTLFAGEGPRGVIDQLSREPESLATSLAWALRSVGHPKLVMGFDALLVIAPEHGRVLDQAGWDRDRLRRELMQRLLLPFDELERGAGGCAEGLSAAQLGGQTPSHLPKFRDDGLLFARAGGGAGLFSSIIGGWVNGPKGSMPVTRVVGS